MNPISFMFAWARCVLMHKDRAFLWSYGTSKQGLYMGDVYRCNTCGRLSTHGAAQP